MQGKRTKRQLLKRKMMDKQRWRRKKAAERNDSNNIAIARVVAKPTKFNADAWKENSSISSISEKKRSATTGFDPNAWKCHE